MTTHDDEPFTDQHFLNTSNSNLSQQSVGNSPLGILCLFFGGAVLLVGLEMWGNNQSEGI